ncbi:MAG: glycosyltransferase [Ferruginibacter sp.]|nr:glycosyltransferase [Ferruginibacter sp.]
MHPHQNVSIVLPLYNPGNNWVPSFTENIKDLERRAPKGLRFEYIVVNDGSSNSDICEAFDILKNRFNIVYISYEKNCGKGFALRTGVAAGTSPLTVLTDFDFPYGTQNILDMVAHLMNGYELVIGKRNKEYFINLPLKRRFISRMYMILSKFSFSLPMYDIQSGIKGFGLDGKKIFLETKINRFLIDTEFVLCATRKKIPLKVLGVSIKKDVQFSNFGIRIIFTEMKSFISLFKLNHALKKATNKKINEQAGMV